MRAKDVYCALQKLAPFETQMDFDNAGMLIGSMDHVITKVGVSLDVTPQVIAEAVSRGVDCIVSHHPIIFSGLKQIGEDSAVYQAIQKGIVVISAHTNLDAAAGGVNDRLAQCLGLEQVQLLPQPNQPTPAMGRIGRLPAPMNTKSFCELINQALHTRVKVSNLNKTILTVAVCGGSGSDFAGAALAAGADALVTSEIKHHQFLESQINGLLLVDAGHFETEYPVIPFLVYHLTEALAISVEELSQHVPVAYC